MNARSATHRVRALAAVLGLAILLPIGAGADTMLLGPLHVIDIESGAVRAGRTLVIRDGRIESEQPFDRQTAEAAATWINAGGGYAIPGLAEMHAHVPPRAQGEQLVRDVLALYLANGITTIRGMLGEAWHLELRELLDAGAWVGPRLITSGPSFNGRTVTSPEQAAARVREQAEAGYDFLKIHPGIDAAAYAALAEAAHQTGVPFAGHVPVAVGLDAALRAGQLTIDHLDGYAQEMLRADSLLDGIDPEFFGINLGADLDPAKSADLARATARAGTWNVPTQSLLVNIAGERPVEALLQRPEMRYLTPARVTAWRQSLEQFRERHTLEQRRGLLRARRALLAALQDAGAGLLLGSDAPQIMNVPGFSIHEELAFLIEAGLTPLQALQSGTVQVARFLSDEQRGRIEPGHVADLVVLGGNPLEDIAATRRVIGVMKSGHWYGRTWIDQRLEEIAGRGI